MPNKPEFISDERLNEIAEKITTPAELLEYSRARRGLGQIQHKQVFYRSETFFKYLGVALGLSVSVALLISSQFISLSGGALSIARDSYAIVERNLKETEENLMMSQTKLATMDTKLKERSKELEDVNAKLAAQSQELALERLSGTTIFSCDKKHIHGIYNMTSHINSLEPAPDSALDDHRFQMTMRIYMLKESHLDFTAFSRPSGSRFSDRRADSGGWQRVNDVFQLRLKSRGVDVSAYDFDAADLLDFALGKSPKVCAKNGVCFYAKANCLP